MPPLGYPKKFSAQFVHGCLENCQCRPTVSTCDLSINLPVHINNEKVMKDILYSAIKDSYGFGNLYKTTNMFEHLHLGLFDIF